ncbi:MAG: helix-turn-helix domain-containing protein [Bdellovibrionaceae bacterium]|nr:helix-turn-helix domain-containing protein [Bdellovibrionales bacterium]MCB9254483.1 helix-turn-helix domain-containing protein [Pseudobdellovibrionaceae bacterium]
MHPANRAVRSIGFTLSIKINPNRALTGGAQKTLDEVECVHLVKTLRSTEFNLEAAAHRLGISLEELRRRMERHSIPPFLEPLSRD